MNWISVKDRLPEDRELIIAARGDDGWVFVGYIKDADWYNAVDTLMEYHVTHWQPLPSPPGGEREEG